MILKVVDMWRWYCSGMSSYTAATIRIAVVLCHSSINSSVSLAYRFHGKEFWRNIVLLPVGGMVVYRLYYIRQTTTEKVIVTTGSTTVEWVVRMKFYFWSQSSQSKILLHQWVFSEYLKSVNIFKRARHNQGYLTYCGHPASHSKTNHNWPTSFFDTNEHDKTKVHEKK